MKKQNMKYIRRFGDLGWRVCINHSKLTNKYDKYFSDSEYSNNKELSKIAAITYRNEICRDENLSIERIDRKLNPKN